MINPDEDKKGEANIVKRLLSDPMEPHGKIAKTP